MAQWFDWSLLRFICKYPSFKFKAISKIYLFLSKLFHFLNINHHHIYSPCLLISALFNWSARWALFWRGNIFDGFGPIHIYYEITVYSSKVGNYLNMANSNETITSINQSSYWETVWRLANSKSISVYVGNSLKACSSGSWPTYQILFKYCFIFKYNYFSP